MSILTKPYFQARKNNGVLFEPDSDCVLWLPGQDDAYSATIRDRSGYANNGTITQAVWTRGSSGVWGLDFDGTDDKVDCGTDDSLNMLDYVTYLCWIKASRLPSVAGNIHPMFGRGTANGSRGFQITGTGDALRFSIKDNGGTWRHQTSALAITSITDFYFTAMTFDETTLTFYLNDATDNFAFAYDFTSLVVQQRIGEFRADFFEGIIALPRIINRILTASELLGIYNQELPLFGV